MPARLLAIAAAVALAAPAFAAKKAPKDPWAADTAAGKRIAETVQATISAANALLAKPHDAKLNSFFALLQKDTWFVYFGWLEPDGSRFTPAYVLTASRAHPETMLTIDPANAPGNVLPYARAVAASRAAAAKATKNPHVDPVLWPQANGVDVYVLQGGARPGVLLLGGDFLDHWDATGTKLVSRVQFHKGILPVTQSDPTKPDAHTAGSYHTHVIDEGPTATDIAAVLLHPSLAPMFVVGRSGKAYRVDEGGVVHLEPKFESSPATMLNPPAASGPGGLDVPGAEPTDAGAPDAGR
jgi:hypothetical protein